MKETKFLQFNRTIGKHSRVFFLDPTHLMPLSVSVVFGILVGQICSLDFFWTVLWMAAPFVTWLIVVGDKPWKYLSQFDAEPRWTRGRVMVDKPLHKRRIGKIIK